MRHLLVVLHHDDVAALDEEEGVSHVPLLDDDVVFLVHAHLQRRHQLRALLAAQRLEERHGAHQLLQLQRPALVAVLQDALVRRAVHVPQRAVRRAADGLVALARVQQRLLPEALQRLLRSHEFPAVHKEELAPLVAVHVHDGARGVFLELHHLHQPVPQRRAQAGEDVHHLERGLDALALRLSLARLVEVGGGVVAARAEHGAAAGLLALLVRAAPDHLLRHGLGRRGGGVHGGRRQALGGVSRHVHPFAVPHLPPRHRARGRGAVRLRRTGPSRTGPRSLAWCSSWRPVR
mmetsp:Transcript_13559/g.46857  ORF Transcript_13559/g.46857 Transcript_13559/m.46857 type:complete len:292 (+) Transcript_13559:1953-2828(+)